MSLNRTVLLAALAIGAGEAAAQSRADGTYPGFLVCEALAFVPASRDPVILEVAGGRATLSRTSGGRESASGAVGGGQLVLTGGGAGFTSRYAGEVGGRGGLLTGVQTWTRSGGTHRRACQLTVGNGRG